MSNSTNINKLSSLIHTLWELELQEYYLGKADVLQSVIQTLRTIRNEMVVERENKIDAITTVILKVEGGGG
jgi:hypothetical protein